MALKSVIEQAVCNGAPACFGWRALVFRGMLAAVVALGVAAQAVASDDGVHDYPSVPTLPSGVVARIQEILLDEKADGVLTYARYRFVAPGVSGAAAPDFKARLEDMQFLCDAYALNLTPLADGLADRIVISISDRETEFGVSDPDVTQFFEIYSTQNGACIWEEF